MLVLVHGGAASVASSLIDEKLAELRKAVKCGFISLMQSDSSVNGVQSAVQYMEDSPYFNAGFGSSLTSAGTVEMDSIIVDGKTLNFGAVSAVTDYPNPVSIARAIMDKSQHCMFTAAGAHNFAKDCGFVSVDRSKMIHQMAKDRLDEYRTFQNSLRGDRALKNGDHDTVGSVAVDRYGNVAAATSTGGITGKHPGRVGDSPVIGSGAYADNQTGAVSTTGHGEAIMKVCLARDVLCRYEKSRGMQAAVDDSLRMMQERVEGFGGVIAVSANADIGIQFNTVGMPWAYITTNDNANFDPTNNDVKLNIHYGYKPGEHRTVCE